MELAGAGDLLAVESQNHVAFSQARLFCRAVLYDIRHADTAHLTQSVGAHVFFGHIFSVDAEKSAALQEESEVVVTLPVGLLIEIPIKISVPVKIKIGFRQLLGGFWRLRRLGGLLGSNDPADDQTATDNQRERQ